jgi:hypothetical protein
VLAACIQTAVAGLLQHDACDCQLQLRPCLGASAASFMAPGADVLRCCSCTALVSQKVGQKALSCKHNAGGDSTGVLHLWSHMCVGHPAAHPAGCLGSGWLLMRGACTLAVGRQQSSVSVTAQPLVRCWASGCLLSIPKDPGYCCWLVPGVLDTTTCL